jgi:hypothetical protein
MVARLRLVTSEEGAELKRGLANKARPANPAMSSLFHAGRRWRGVADARRSAGK